MNQPTQLPLPLSIFDSSPAGTSSREAKPCVDSGFGFGFVVKRSARRRTIELQINNGKVVLMLPAFVSNAEGLAFVRQKREWVLETLAKQQKFLSEVVPKKYVDGEVFQFLGRQYPLNIVVASKSGVELINGKLLVKLRSSQLKTKSEAVKKTLWRWYHQQANEVLSRKTTTVAAEWKLKVKEVQIRKTKSEWGHCTADNVIQYNWVVILAPEPVVDYLIAHEVSHLKHRNHSKSFWAYVEKIYPEFKPARKWLKDYGHTLTV